jgi:hypothetical protein
MAWTLSRPFHRVDEPGRDPPAEPIQQRLRPPAPPESRPRMSALQSREREGVGFGLSRFPNPVYREQTQFPRLHCATQTTNSKAFVLIPMPPINWLCLGLLSPKNGFTVSSDHSESRAKAFEIMALPAQHKIGFALRPAPSHRLTQ